MKRTIGIALWICAGALGFGLAAGCGKAEGVALGGETHWLASCASDAACDPGLDCLCGVCTISCEADAACSGAGATARCVTQESAPFGSGCGSSDPERICSLPEELPTTLPREALSIFGRRYDAQNGCFGPERQAGSIATVLRGPRPCAEERTFALDAAGNCWRFSDACIPDGFVPFSEFTGPVPPCTVSEDLCEPGSCSADTEILTTEGCLDCDDARRALRDAVARVIDDQGWAQCDSDSDCVAEDWQTACDGQCPVALNASSVETFRAGIDAIASGYCMDGGTWRETCGSVVVDCDIAPLCRQGQCVISTLPCAARSLEACVDESGDCELATALPYDAANQCFDGSPTPVACADPDLSCPPVVTAAMDAQGNCYSFGGCLPSGFVRAPEDHPCSAAVVGTCGG